MPRGEPGVLCRRQRTFRMGALAFLFLAGLPGLAPAQSQPDSLHVNNREFLRLFRQSEKITAEQKDRAKRTVNPRVLLRLAQVENPSVRFYVAFNPHTPVEALVPLSKDPNEIVRWAVAMNTRLLFTGAPNLTTGLDRKQVSIDLARAFRINGFLLAGSTKVTVVQPGQRWRIGNGSDVFRVKREGTRVQVFNTFLPKDVLLSLARDYTEIVRLGLASNPQTPPDVLRTLAGDVSMSVRRHVAENPGTDPSVLELLSKDRDSSVRLAVAKNPRTPLRVMERFSVDSDSTLRLAVASNTGTSPAILLGLIFDPQQSVRQAAAGHPDMPKAGLIRLSQDPDTGVRLAVAENPNTPAEALRRLAFDTDQGVKEIARGRLTTILQRQIARDREQ